MKRATPEQWEKLLSRFKKETDAQEKTKLMGALAAIDNKEILKRYVLFANRYCYYYRE